MSKVPAIDSIETETISADGKRVITRAKMPKEEVSISDAIVGVLTVACFAYCGYRAFKVLSGRDSSDDVALIGSDVALS